VLATLARQSVSTAGNTDWPCAIGATTQRACPLVRGWKPAARGGVSRAPGLRTGGCILAGDSTHPACVVLQVLLHQTACCVACVCRGAVHAVCSKPCTMFDLPHCAALLADGMATSQHRHLWRSAGPADAAGRQHSVLSLGASALEQCGPLRH
jgi:hypothetical protein